MRELRDCPGEKLATAFTGISKLIKKLMLFWACSSRFPGRSIAKSQIERHRDFEVLMGHLVQTLMWRWGEWLGEGLSWSHEVPRSHSARAGTLGSGSVTEADYKKGSKTVEKLSGTNTEGIVSMKGGRWRDLFKNLLDIFPILFLEFRVPV